MTVAGGSLPLSLNILNFTEHEFYSNKRIATSVLIVFACLLFITCINVIYDWAANILPDTTLPTIRTPHITYHLQDISSWHLLGGNPNTGNLPETNLQLTLQGVLTSSGTGHASAIIAEPGKPGRVYQPGDLLPGGAILDKVMVDRVIIRNRGKLETLSLVRAKLQFAPVPSSMWS